MPAPDKPSDWAGAHKRQQIASMPGRAVAARALIEAATRLRMAVNSGDNHARSVQARHRSEWPQLWEQIDSLCASIEGYK